MASKPSPSPLTYAFLFLLLITTTTSTPLPTSSPLQEHETMLENLRINGYTLFTNAIATSDLQLHLQSTPFATIFAAQDSPLYDLDMASDAVDYVSTLLYHVIPDRRHTFSDLQNLSSPFLDTLLPNYAVLIGKTRKGSVLGEDSSLVGVMVDGVRVSDPDLFVGERVAVHGIDGILVTGLNIYHGSIGEIGNRIGNGNGSDVLSPAEPPTFGNVAPAPQLDRNPIESAPMSPVNVPVASPVIHVPVASPVIHVPVASPVIHVPVASPVNLVPIASPVNHVPEASPVNHVPVASPVSTPAPAPAQKVQGPAAGGKKSRRKHHHHHHKGRGRRGRHDHRLNDL